ncbi:hypothetical protein SAMN05880582_1011430 [Rhizobium sp. RU20A]|uniref:bleomycin resistance protein n=1 Tax=Rhizobium sp. RU20A TaxID=1907412 RepID=UPI0009542E08|nr:VOC family protein [Rhizobium sp. RU20A]SIQ30659.1 hypothetical protein SAMN05880582_1011430 [Rhizobium sp. RU20A]
MSASETEAGVEALPVLPSLDMGETEAFYGAKLGFTTTYRDDTYLILRRGIAELHFWRAGDRTLCENTSVYLRGDGIVELYAEYQARGDIQRLSPLMDRDWGMQEFYIHDPHGNLLRFGRRLPLPER